MDSRRLCVRPHHPWIPAFAGMTERQHIPIWDKLRSDRGVGPSPERRVGLGQILAWGMRVVKRGVSEEELGVRATPYPSGFPLSRE